GGVIHTDAVQAAGKLKINVKKANIDMLSISGHKLHAPKGIGAIYIRNGLKIEPLIHGGHQERGMRAGTENVAFCVGLGVACELANKFIDKEDEIKKLRDWLEEELLKRCAGAKLNGHKEKRVYNTTNISFEDIEGEAILLHLDEYGIAASSGSACTSGSLEPSHVMRAMGVPYNYAHSSIRFSLSRYTTREEVEKVIEVMPKIVDKLRAISPFVSVKKTTDIKEEIEKLKKEKNAVILAHNYQPAEIQDCADYVGDSYGLSVEASRTNADIIIFAGVRFMAETAAILNPKKKVILVEPMAGCPMAEMISPEELKGLKEKYPDYLVMCYVNSTAEIKALSDVCCTSANAVKIAKKIPEERGIIFVPDKYLGSWVIEQTGRKNIVLWDGFCPTHMRITPEKILKAKREHPEAEVLIHPEATSECRKLADVVLSTGGMCDYVAKSNKKEFIIATEVGLIYTLRKNNPQKEFFAVSPNILCPNMKRTRLESIRDSLIGNGGEEIRLPENIVRLAQLSLKRMLELSA
ncbi:MAG: quinolinate synthase NadA, partial [Chitinispirillaceae bacterium]|nr:quinolinate synthase NadA [Chitinispirillaceae bacterium]